MLGPKAVELPRGLIEHDGLLKFHHAPPEQLAANRYRAAEYVPTTTTVSATIDPPSTKLAETGFVRQLGVCSHRVPPRNDM